jgi:hypothetical protein
VSSAQTSDIGVGPIQELAGLETRMKTDTANESAGLNSGHPLRLRSCRLNVLRKLL